MQFIALISRLTSSLISIQKVASFAVKHGQKCGDDIWDCLVEECAQINLNQRINLLFFLDTLLENSTVGLPYRHLVKRDLAKLVQLVVPQTREGVLNLMSADQVSPPPAPAPRTPSPHSLRPQVLRSWKTRRILDAEIIDPILETLQERRTTSVPPLAPSHPRSYRITQSTRYSARSYRHHLLLQSRHPPQN